MIICKFLVNFHIFLVTVLLSCCQIVDPTATKPDDWDEDAPAQIVDPNAVKPEGWLDDEPDMIPGEFNCASYRLHIFIHVIFTAPYLKNKNRYPCGITLLSVCLSPS